MELVRIVAPLARLSEVAQRASQRSLVFCCADGDTVIAAAALEGIIDGPIGVWLELSDDYSAQMAARDVATLSWIIELDQVVIVSEDLSHEQAEVVRELMSDGEVNFQNAAATLTGAYNRPSPPSPITVWSFDGEELRAPGHVLHKVAVATPHLDEEITTFA